MKIALVHDYLNEAGGAEKVLRVLSDMYPEAPIYTSFAKRGTARAMFEDRKIIESKWAPILKIGRIYSYCRFLLPWVWKSVDLRAYDLVITSCAGYIARGFRVRPATRVIAYCHTPPKWLYGYETPTGAAGKWWGRMFMWVVGPWVRYFDYQSAQRVNTWMANSQEVAGRVAKFYRKEAIVVYPPIEMSDTRRHKSGVRDYYLVVSRIVGGKGIVEAIEGVKRARVKLKVVGETVGGSWKWEEGVEYLGRVGEEQLDRLYAGAKGFIALARDEDFGMTVVEAMAHGTPVVALNSGGYKETVISANRQIGRSANRLDGRSVDQKMATGILIEDTNPQTVAQGIKKLEKINWDREEIKRWAKKFGRDRFEKEIRGVINA